MALIPLDPRFRLYNNNAEIDICKDAMWWSEYIWMKTSLAAML